MYRLRWCNVSIFFIKSILSIFILILAVVLMVTMFEVLGRSDRKYNINTLKGIHRISGYMYILIFLVIAFFCLQYIVSAKTELSSRASLHSFLAVTILALFGIKLSFIKAYRQFYEHVKNIGLIIAVLTFGLVSSSAGYYLLVSEFGTDISFEELVDDKKDVLIEEDNNKIQGIILKTDAGSIERGKKLFASKCRFCHHPDSTETNVGPGLKGVLKNPRLPVSKSPAVPENIIKQLRQPFARMPSFDYFSHEEIDDILAFLNTL